MNSWGKVHGNFFISSSVSNPWNRLLPILSRTQVLIASMYTKNGTFKIHPPKDRILTKHDTSYLNPNSSYNTWIHPHKNSMNNWYSIQDEHMNLTTRRVTHYTQQQDYQLPHNQDCKYSSKRNENNSKQESKRKASV